MRDASSEQRVTLRIMEPPTSISEEYDAKRRRQQATSYEAYCAVIARHIAAQPRSEHKQHVEQALVKMQQAGVDGDLIELLLCALGEVG